MQLRPSLPSESREKVTDFSLLWGKKKSPGKDNSPVGVVTLADFPFAWGNSNLLSLSLKSIKISGKSSRVTEGKNKVSVCLCQQNDYIVICKNVTEQITYKLLWMRWYEHVLKEMYQKRCQNVSAEKAVLPDTWKNLRCLGKFYRK